MFSDQAFLAARRPTFFCWALVTPPSTTGTIGGSGCTGGGGMFTTYEPLSSYRAGTVPGTIMVHSVGGFCQ